MGECSLLDLHVRMQINLGGFHRFMSEPESNDAYIHASSEKSHRGCVAQSMRSDLFANERWTRLPGVDRVFRYETLQCICTQSATARTRKDRITRFSGLLRHPPLQDCNDFRS